MGNIIIKNIEYNEIEYNKNPETYIEETILKLLDANDISEVDKYEKVVIGILKQQYK